MVGLTRSELAPSTLRAGDIVEYYSLQHVCGDARGHRIAVILEVSPALTEYPLSFDTGEMLPKQGWIRKRTVTGETKPGEKWRKLQTFTLEKSKVDRPTRANYLNQQLRAIAETPITELLSRRSYDEPISSQAQGDVLCGKTIRPDHEVGNEAITTELNEVADSDYVAQPAMTLEDNIDELGKIPKTNQRWKRHHRANPKKDGGWSKRSRKKWHLRRCKPTYDTKAVWHAHTPQSRFLRGFLKLPHVQAALAARRKNTVTHALAIASESGDNCEPNALAESSVQEMIPVQVGPAPAGYTPGSSINADDACEMIGYADGKDNEAGAVKWPSDVIRICGLLNPYHVVFKTDGDVDPCECTDDCFLDSCINSKTDVFCTKGNCNLEGNCSNSLGEHPALEIFESTVAGIGVRSRGPIHVGVVVGEYAGVLQSFPKPRVDRRRKRH